MANFKVFDMNKKMYLSLQVNPLYMPFNCIKWVLYREYSYAAVNHTATKPYFKVNIIILLLNILKNNIIIIIVEV